MKKITSRHITSEHIEKVNNVLGFKDGEKALSDYGYAFYYNQMFVHDLDLCDADRYANLNTILGYDVGINKFRSLDGWLWEHGYDLMELCGSDEDKEWLHRATVLTDRYKTRNFRIPHRIYILTITMGTDLYGFIVVII